MWLLISGPDSGCKFVAPGDSQPDSRLNTAALLIQRSWRRSSQRRVQAHTARARECEDSDVLAAFAEACHGQEVAYQEVGNMQQAFGGYDS